uniref:Cullin domain-containing protein n=1 Tax=Strongyloides venezuelensis TaxID=75913 RepID=A0A0K0FPG1_STRVS
MAFCFNRSLKLIVGKLEEKDDDIGGLSSIADKIKKYMMVETTRELNDVLNKSYSYYMEVPLRHKSSSGPRYTLSY